jgi:hypothetical protein
LKNLLDIRLHALKAVDAILAALQTTFAQPNLLGDGVDFRYLENDPANSKVWICDPDAREGYDRTGNRMLITVSRGDFQPMDMHLHNRGQSSWNADAREFTDLCNTPVFIRCEAGNKTQSEMLASIVYQALKWFRPDLMKEFDLFDLKVTSVGSPTQLTGVQGEPWLTGVSLVVSTQEVCQISEIKNSLNRLELIGRIKKSALAAFDIQSDQLGGVDGG